MADEESLQAVSDDGSLELIYSHDEIEGRGLKEIIAAAALLGAFLPTMPTAEAGIFFNRKKDKTVQVEFTLNDESIMIQVEDQGPGFSPDELPDPTAEENLPRPNGRGVMLMRAYMTEVDFNERGNRVILTKRRDCQRPHAD